MPRDREFDAAWREKERQGYQYGPDALQGVRVGWNIRKEHEQKATADVRRKAIEDCQEWMRQHLSGISAPNEEDYKDMLDWLDERARSER